MMLSKLLFLLLLTVATGESSLTINIKTKVRNRKPSTSTCVSASRSPIDWFLMYKLPGDCTGKPWIRGDVALYTDSNMVESGSPWQISSVDDWYPLKATLSQIETSGTGHVFYNDEPPYYRGMPHPSYLLFERFAHSKGVLHFNNSHGVWMQHSIPRWPNVTSATSWNEVPLPQTCNAQHVLCMSLTTSEIDSSVVDILSAVRPTVYKVKLRGFPHSFLARLRRFLSQRYHPYAQQPVEQSTLTTVGGTLRLRTFQKTNARGQYPGAASYTGLMDEVVVPQLNSSMVWQTWRTRLFATRRHPCSYALPPQGLLSNCTLAPLGLQLHNAKGLAVPMFLAHSHQLAVGQRQWAACQDHSKWGITDSSLTTAGQVQWSCFGDHNRELSQWHRGGAVLCSSLLSLHIAMQQVVKEVEECHAPEGALAGIKI